MAFKYRWNLLLIDDVYLRGVLLSCIYHVNELINYIIQRYIACMKN